MANDLGAGHWLGFKRQLVAGTPETTVDVFLSTENVDMNANPDPMPRKTFAGTGRTLPSRKGWIKPDGKSLTEVMASQPHPWLWLLGAGETSTVHTGVYLHSLEDGPAPLLLTGEANRAFDQCKQGDIRLAKIKLMAQPGEPGKMELVWFALSHEDGATLTSTPVFVTDVLTCRNVVVKIAGSQDLTVQDCDLEWDNALEQLPVLEESDGAPRTVRRKEPPKASGSLKFIDFPTAQLTKFREQTPFSLEVNLLGDAIGETGHNKFLRVTLPACQYTGGLAPTIAEQVVTGEANYEGYYDTVTGRQILVEAQNSISDIGCDQSA